MITGALKSKIDSIWDTMWSGGISNPLSVIEQLTYLLFMKRLDELHTLKERKAARTGTPIQEPVFGVDLRGDGNHAFRAFKSDRIFRFTIDDRGYEWGVAKITEPELRRIAAVDGGGTLVGREKSERRSTVDSGSGRRGAVRESGAAVVRTTDEGAGPHLLKDVFEGRKFEDGKPVSTRQRKNAA